MNQIAIERRQFLQASGGLVVSFALAGTMPALAQNAAGGKSLAADAVDSYLVIAPDGAVTLYSGKVDMGTGARVAYRQIVAEELDVAFDRIAMIEGDTGLCPDQGGTGGSTGIVNGGVQLRRAAASARAALLAKAASVFSVPANALSVSEGTVRTTDGRSISYGELIAGGHFDVKLDPKAPLKDPNAYKIVNQSAKRPDLPAK
jgi:CO/xanthine dehydrogenase Mo-binding subunit